MSSPLDTAKRVVVKIGSALLAGAEDGEPARAWLDGLAEDISVARSSGTQFIIVSSGAIALGRTVLDLKGPLKLEEKQAAAAAGQARLMRVYDEAFERFGLPVAQALLTLDDTERRRRWLNARATLETLLNLNAVPIINENDTVATAEIRYGDNDRLAARVAQMVSADVLILLSDVDGLYDRDPRVHAGAQRIAEVREITPAIEAMAGAANGAGPGSGGMRTKLEAARIATRAGCAVAILHGASPNPLARLRAGAPATWFIPSATACAAYKAWIAGHLAPQGEVIVDAGAAVALRAGKSLLPAGVVHVRGGFEKGDAVRIIDVDDGEIARGIARYDASDAARIKGLKSTAIERVLGYAASAVLVHADDLVLTAR